MPRWVLTKQPSRTYLPPLFCHSRTQRKSTPAKILWHGCSCTLKAILWFDLLLLLRRCGYIRVRKRPERKKTKQKSNLLATFASERYCQDSTAHSPEWERRPIQSGSGAGAQRDLHTQASALEHRGTRSCAGQHPSCQQHRNYTSTAELISHVPNTSGIYLLQTGDS